MVWFSVWVKVIALKFHRERKHRRKAAPPTAPLSGRDIRIIISEPIDITSDREVAKHPPEKRGSRSGAPRDSIIPATTGRAVLPPAIKLTSPTDLKHNRNSLKSPVYRDSRRISARRRRSKPLPPLPPSTPRSPQNLLLSPQSTYSRASSSRGLRLFSPRKKPKFMSVIDTTGVKAILKVVYEYEAQSADEIDIKEDQIVYLLDDSDEDWSKIQLHLTLDELASTPAPKPTVGLVPAAYLGPHEPLAHATALYDYDANGDGEISIVENERMEVYIREDDWIFVGINRPSKNAQGEGRFGFIPGNYVEEGDGDAPIEPTPEPEPERAAVPPPAPIAIPPPVTSLNTTERAKQAKASIKDDPVETWNASEVDKKGKKKKGSLGVGNGAIFFASESDKNPVQQISSSTIAVVTIDSHKSKHVIVEFDDGETIQFNAASKDEAEAIVEKMDSSRRIAKSSQPSTSNGRANGAAHDTPSPPPAASAAPRFLPPPVRNDAAATAAKTKSRGVHFDSAPPTEIAPRKGVQSDDEADEAELTPQDALGGQGDPALAMYDFDADGEDELSVKEGERLLVIDKEGSDEWWRCRDSNGNEGVVPASYLELEYSEDAAAQEAARAKEAKAKQAEEEKQRKRQQEEADRRKKEAERRRAAEEEERRRSKEEERRSMEQERREQERKEKERQLAKERKDKARESNQSKTTSSSASDLTTISLSSPPTTPSYKLAGPSERSRGGRIPRASLDVIEDAVKDGRHHYGHPHPKLAKPSAGRASGQRFDSVVGRATAEAGSSRPEISVYSAAAAAAAASALQRSAARSNTYPQDHVSRSGTRSSPRSSPPPSRPIPPVPIPGRRELSTPPESRSYSPSPPPMPGHFGRSASQRSKSSQHDFALRSHLPFDPSRSSPQWRPAYMQPNNCHDCPECNDARSPSSPSSPSALPALLYSSNPSLSSVASSRYHTPSSSPVNTSPISGRLTGGPMSSSPVKSTSLQRELFYAHKGVGSASSGSISHHRSRSASPSPASPAVASSSHHRSDNSTHRPSGSKDLPGRPSSSSEKPKPTNTRTWHDRTGQFKVEAELLQVKDGMIRLHKVNGVIIEVPVEKMSKEDKEFIDGLQSRGALPTGARATSPQVDEDNIPLDTLRRNRNSVVPQPQPPPKKPAVDWFDFFLSAGCDLDDSTRYATSFEKDKMDAAILSDVGADTLRAIGLREGDIIRVLKQIEKRGWKLETSKADDPRVKRQLEADEELARRLQKEEFSGRASPGSAISPAPGLFTGPGGVLKNNTRRGRPTPSKSASLAVDADAITSASNTISRTNSPNISGPGGSRSSPPERSNSASLATVASGFGDDAWTPRPASAAGTKSAAATAPAPKPLAAPTLQPTPVAPAPAPPPAPPVAPPAPAVQVSAAPAQQQATGNSIQRPATSNAPSAKLPSEFDNLAKIGSWRPPSAPIGPSATGTSTLSPLSAPPISFNHGLGMGSNPTPMGTFLAAQQTGVLGSPFNNPNGPRGPLAPVPANQGLLQPLIPTNTGFNSFVPTRPSSIASSVTNTTLGSASYLTPQSATFGGGSGFAGSGFNPMGNAQQMPPMGVQSHITGLGNFQNPLMGGGSQPSLTMQPTGMPGFNSPSPNLMSPNSLQPQPTGMFGGGMFSGLPNTQAPPPFMPSNPGVKDTSPANIFASMKTGTFANESAPQSSDKYDALRTNSTSPGFLTTQPTGWAALNALQAQPTGFQQQGGFPGQPGFQNQQGFQQGYPNNGYGFGR